jgi:hypothetical protein
MKITLIAFLISLLMFSGACSVKNEPEPIVVGVFRNPDAAELEKAILAVGYRQLRTSHGRPIVIATYEPKSYADELTMLGRRYHPELIIFNSPEDGEKAKVEIPPQSSLEVSRKRYYLVIPAWVTGEDREAAQLVMAGLRQELSKTTSNP